MKSGRSIPGILTATVLGSGYSPVAPGTAGSIVSAAAFVAVRSCTPPWLVFALLPPVVLAALWGCRAGYAMWGHDPSRVNVDEFAGCWIACLAVPVSWGIAGIAAGLVLFRLFDILKPWPVSRLDWMKTPAGILLDDVAAGLLSALLIAIGVLLYERVF